MEPHPTGASGAAAFAPRPGILILDFGSQVTQLIARRLREAAIFCEIMPFSADFARIAAFAPRGIILSGGPASVTDPESPRVQQAVLDMGVPIFGICYGQQELVRALGGRVEPGDTREFGRAYIDISANSALFSAANQAALGTPQQTAWQQAGREQVWMSHGDRVTALPPGFVPVAASEGAPYAVIADEARRIYAVQFHPEVMHTPHGASLLAGFAAGICGVPRDWTMASFRDEEIARIRAQVAQGRVICGLSGGVDSSVAAVLINEAIGSQLTCIFVDHGLLRAGEAADVVAMFQGKFGIHLVHRDASKMFVGALAGVTDPETKRKIIGRLFIEVFEEEAAKIGGADFLAQGTLYPDVIESVSVSGGPSVTIKSHHNVGGLPDRMRMKLVEPLRALFKDEVRVLGRELGLPAHIVGRHPFPGPGLAIRIPGAVDFEKLEILRKADAIYLEEIRAAGLYDAIWQAFAVLLPVRTVGVMGDGRTYDQVCGLRAVTSTDGMTADMYPFEMGFLARVAGRIVNEVRGINRVVYDITSKPPGTIEWE